MWHNLKQLFLNHDITRQTALVYSNFPTPWRNNFFLLWKSNRYYIFWVCVCSLRYPACTANAPYCNLWPAPLYNIFPHYLINGTILEKKLLNTKCVFWFSLQHLSKTFLILRRAERDIIINIITHQVKYRIFLWECNENPILEIFEKNSKYQISWKYVQCETSFFFSRRRTYKHSWRR